MDLVSCCRREQEFKNKVLSTHLEVLAGGAGDDCYSCSNGLLKGACFPGQLGL